MPHYATWPPKVQNRQYILFDGTKVSAELRGNELPAKRIVDNFDTKEVLFHDSMLKNTRLYTDLPPPFFNEFLKIQRSSSPFKLPKIMENKNVTVSECFKNHPAFKMRTGSLHPNQWKQLGWKSPKAYKNWLNTSMLFAFSHCMHYCSAPRVFDEDIEQNESDGEMFYFKQVMRDSHSPHKNTNILSVTGFEFRNYKGSIRETLEGVREHSKKTVEYILQIATLQEITDLVMIPYGMGVFIPKDDNGRRIVEATYQGMVDALKEYQGPNLSIHCCGGPDFYTNLNSSNNNKIYFYNRTGLDAYTIANNYENYGQEGSCQPGTNRPYKSMLINAADNDWTALLDPTKKPGQFSNNHNLFMGTSDEYFALVMGFAYFSIQRIMDFFGSLFLCKIIQVGSKSEYADEPEHQDGVEPQSSLSFDQLAQIYKLINKLQREIDSCWPYPNKDLKQHKIDGLEELINLSFDMHYSEAMEQVRKLFPNMCLGDFSTRTADLLFSLIDDYNLQQAHSKSF